MSNQYTSTYFNNESWLDPYWTNFGTPSVLGNCLLGCLLIVILAGSLVGNGLIMFLIWRNDHLRSGKVFIFNICIANFCAPWTYCLFIVNSFRNVWSFPYFMCQLYAFVQGVCSFVTLCLIAAMAWDSSRAIAANRPAAVSIGSMKPWTQKHPERSVVATLVIWIYCFAIMTPPFFGYSQYMVAGTLITCCFDYITRRSDVIGFIGIIVVFGFVAPCCLIARSWFKVYQTLRIRKLFNIEQDRNSKPNFNFDRTNLKSRSSVKDTAMNDSLDLLTQPGKQKEFVISTHKDHDINLNNFYQAGVLFCVFMAVWTPYAILVLLGQFGPSNLITPWAAMVPAVIAKSSTLYNPLVYYWMDADIRIAIQNLKLFPLRATRSDRPKGKKAAYRKNRNSETMITNNCSL